MRPPDLIRGMVEGAYRALAAPSVALRATPPPPAAEVPRPSGSSHDMAGDDAGEQEPADPAVRAESGEAVGGIVEGDQGRL